MNTLYVIKLFRYSDIPDNLGLQLHKILNFNKFTILCNY